MPNPAKLLIFISHSASTISCQSGEVPDEGRLDHYAASGGGIKDTVDTGRKARIDGAGLKNVAARGDRVGNRLGVQKGMRLESR